MVYVRTWRAFFLHATACLGHTCGHHGFNESWSLDFHIRLNLLCLVPGCMGGDGQSSCAAAGHSQPNSFSTSCEPCPKGTKTKMLGSETCLGVCGDNALGLCLQLPLLGIHDVLRVLDSKASDVGGMLSLYLKMWLNSLCKPSVLPDSM